MRSFGTRERMKLEAHMTVGPGSLSIRVCTCFQFFWCMSMYGDCVKKMLSASALRCKVKRERTVAVLVWACRCHTRILHLPYFTEYSRSTG